MNSKVLPGNTDKFKDIVGEVQFAMLAFGYYTGELDGVLGSAMKIGLQKLQADYGLKVTGTITRKTLTALRITARKIILLRNLPLLEIELSYNLENRHVRHGMLSLIQFERQRKA